MSNGPGIGDSGAQVARGTRHSEAVGAGIIPYNENSYPPELIRSDIGGGLNPFQWYQKGAPTPAPTSDWRTGRIHAGLLQYLLSGTPVHPLTTSGGATDFSDDADTTEANTVIVLTASATNYIWLEGTTATDGSAMSALTLKTATTAPTLPSPGADAWPSSFIIPVWSGVLGDDTAKTITSPNQNIRSNLVVWPGWQGFSFSGTDLVVGGQFLWSGI